jgi:hypothetical protein
MVQFILQNTGGNVTMPVSNLDPYTGSGAYVPSAGSGFPSSGSTQGTVTGGGVDPYTGKSDYQYSSLLPLTPSSASSPTLRNTPLSRTSHMQHHHRPSVFVDVASFLGVLDDLRRYVTAGGAPALSLENAPVVALKIVQPFSHRYARPRPQRIARVRDVRGRR